MRAGLELEHWPDDPRVREVQDAFVAAHADDWDIVLGSVHCLTGDHSIFDASIPLGSERGLGRLPRRASATPSSTAATTSSRIPCGSR